MAFVSLGRRRRENASTASSMALDRLQRHHAGLADPGGDTARGLYAGGRHGSARSGRERGRSRSPASSAIGRAPSRRP